MTIKAPVGQPSHQRRDRRGRGRRPADLLNVARERMDLLFAQADSAARMGDMAQADRCVALASTIGTRYNIRLRIEQRRRFCRGCRGYLVPGRNARARIRGRLILTCRRCGRVARIPLGP